MENLDVIILSCIVITLFAVFIGFTARELINAEKQPQTSQTGERGPRADMIKFIGRLFDSPALDRNESDKKIDFYKRVEKVMTDMESDGVYFSDDVKKELLKKREELWCEYSNLPSVKSYEREN